MYDMIERNRDLLTVPVIKPLRGETNMIATTNLPGSKHFSWFHGTKKECEDWLEEQKKKHQDEHGGVWTSTYLPAQIHTDKKAMRWRYRDGTRVFPFHAGKFDNNSQYDYPGNDV